MKRLALLLGSLLVVSAAASAKEVVPAPVVVEETPVQVVEKEVIVYRDKEPEWRPSGFVSLQQTYYGTTEGQKITNNDATPTAWNTYNDYMRTQLEGRVQMTPKQAIDFRGRLYQNTHRSNYDATTKTGNKYNSKDDQFRVRYYYDHGTLGDSQVDMMSRLKYEKNGSGRGTQEVQYVLEFDFAKYMFNNDYVKTTKFVVGPALTYSWADDMVKHINAKGIEESKGAGSSTAVGIYFDWITELPYGFGTELELDTMNLAFGNTDGVFTNAKGMVGTDKTYSSESRKFTLPVKFLLTHSWNLWSNDAYSLDWYAEGGYDTYTFSNRDSYSGSNTPSKESYTLKFEPTVTLTYKATNFVSIYGTVGAEYSNWVNTNQKDASNWRWQPYATVGVKTTF